jgi:hypothetical protein
VPRTRRNGDDEALAKLSTNARLCVTASANLVVGTPACRRTRCWRISLGLTEGVSPLEVGPSIFRFYAERGENVYLHRIPHITLDFHHTIMTAATPVAMTPKASVS